VSSILSGQSKKEYDVLRRTSSNQVMRMHLEMMNEAVNLGNDTTTTTNTLTKDATVVLSKDVDQNEELLSNLWGSILNRIDKIEAEIGISKLQPRRNVDICLGQLKDSIHTKIPTSLLEDVVEIERIQKLELNASQVSTDRFHQREEILSCAKTYQTSLGQLDQIQSLLQQSSLLHGPSEDRFRLAIESLPRLNHEENNLESLWQRTNKLAFRIDTLVQRYHNIIVALSEKLILIDEQLCNQDNAAKDNNPKR
jgi:hypothetical protein